MMKNPDLIFLLILGNIMVCVSSLSAQTPSLTGVVNEYAQVLKTTDCSNTIVVGDIDEMDLAEGDRVLIIQMKGGVVNSLDQVCCPYDQTAGSVLSYNAVGKFEFATVDEVEALPPQSGESRNRVTLKNVLKNLYEVGLWGEGDNRVQLVKIPLDVGGELFSDLEIGSGGVTAPPWNNADSYVGGVLALEITGTLTLNGNIDVSGMGYQGGEQSDAISYNLILSSTRDRVISEGGAGGQKGEGINSVLGFFNAGRGWIANGGGGGNLDGAGGGGGGNYGMGGSGGTQASNPNFDPDVLNGGEGGEAMNYVALGTRAFMGGGGGGGQAGEYTMTDPDLIDPSVLTDPCSTCGASGGARGGGIVIIRAAKIVANGKSILAKGADADDADNAGAGGGGAGGTVLLSVPEVDGSSGSLAIDISGGNGGNAIQIPLATSPTVVPPPASFGPGGGGGGGLVWCSGGTRDNVTVTKTGGEAGEVIKVNLSSDGHREASNGVDGAIKQYLLLPGDPLP